VISVKKTDKILLFDGREVQKKALKTLEKKFTKLTTSLISVYTYIFGYFDKNDRRRFLSVNGKCTTFLF